VWPRAQHPATADGPQRALRSDLRAPLNSRVRCYADSPIGHVVLNTNADRLCSQYSCCIVAGNREFVLKHPVATKRALRAIVKAADLCALEPDRAAQLLVNKAYVERHHYAPQTMKEVPDGKWREYDPENP
jgi:NitT/TauT family transport system substrate-binding protein